MHQIKDLTKFSHYVVAYGNHIPQSVSSMRREFILVGKAKYYGEMSQMPSMQGKYTCPCKYN